MVSQREIVADEMKFHYHLSVSNIFLGATIPVSLGILSFGGVMTQILVKIVLIVYFGLILVAEGLHHRQKAMRLIEKFESG